MKSVKILIGALILATSFNACKKDEITSQPGEVGLSAKGRSGNTLEAVESATATSESSFTVVFDRSGSMSIKGNPGLEKLISANNAGDAAVAAAGEIFALSSNNQLTIAFDKSGNTISSDIPKVPAGSNISNFIYDVCGIKVVDEVTVSITKNDVVMSHLDFWNAVPGGNLESFNAMVAEIQNDMPEGYTYTVTLAGNDEPRFSITDDNGVAETITVPWTGGCTFDPWYIPAWGYAFHCTFGNWFTVY
jgi:hypothetical protein